MNNYLMHLRDDKELRLYLGNRVDPTCKVRITDNATSAAVEMTLDDLYTFQNWIAEYLMGMDMATWKVVEEKR